MNPPEYFEEYGQVYLRHGSEVIGMHDNLVSVCFSYWRDEDGKACAVLHKHGQSEWVQKWYNDTVATYRNAGYDDMAEELHHISSREWDLEELNKIISICDYVGRYYESLLDEADGE